MVGGKSTEQHVQTEPIPQQTTPPTLKQAPQRGDPKPERCFDENQQHV